MHRTSGTASPRAPGGRPPTLLQGPQTVDRCNRVDRLRGRAAELEAIGAALCSVAAGTGGVLLVDGPVGIGKSGLLAEACAMARERGVGVFFGSASECPHAVPLAALLAAATQCATSGAAPPVHPGAAFDLEGWDPQALRSWADAAPTRPVAVVLDGLAWTEIGALTALSAPAARSSTSPILWIIAIRHTRGARALGDGATLLERAGVRRLLLRPLGDHAVSAVIADRLGALPSPDVAALAADAGGSPLLLTALLDEVREQGSLGALPWRTDGGAALPVRVVHAARECLSQVSTGTRELLAIASGLGRSFSLLRLAAASPRKPSTLVAELDEALAAGLLVETGDELRFRHALVRRVIAAAIPRTVGLRADHGNVLEHQNAAERPDSAWDSLTASELRVVRVVARGATNRVAAEQLFLSPHTVSSHLRHTFDKLDIRSRVELAVLYADRERA